MLSLLVTPDVDLYKANKVADLHFDRMDRLVPPKGRGSPLLVNHTPQDQCNWRDCSVGIDFLAAGFQRQGE